MLLLQNNKLITIDKSEDDSVIKAVKYLKDLNPKYEVKDEIRNLIIHSDTRDRVSYGKYNWKVIQSSFNDDSSLGHYYMMFDTKGEAIDRILKDGYSLFINDKLVTREDLR